MKRIGIGSFLVILAVAALPPLASARSGAPAAQAQASSAEVTPSAAHPSEVLPPGSGQATKAKVHKWTGSLVDASCMATALRRVPSASQLLSADPLAQFESQQALKDAAGSARTTAASPLAQTEPPPTSNPEPGLAAGPDPVASEQEMQLEAAELKRQEFLNHQTVLCAPRNPTAHFGLMVSGGSLLKFDSVGDSKATDALRDWVAKPGKTVRAKITGILGEDETTVLVASVQVERPLGHFQSLFESGDLLPRGALEDEPVHL